MSWNAHLFVREYRLIFWLHTNSIHSWCITNLSGSLVFTQVIFPNFLANHPQILAELPVWKCLNLLKSTWKNGFGLVSQLVWLMEIMVNLGPNHVLNGFRGGCVLRWCYEQKLIVCLRVRVSLGDINPFFYSFLYLLSLSQLEVS